MRINEVKRNEFSSSASRKFSNVPSPDFPPLLQRVRDSRTIRRVGDAPKGLRKGGGKVNDLETREEEAEGDREGGSGKVELTLLNAGFSSPCAWTRSKRERARKMRSARCISLPGKWTGSRGK